MIYYSCAVWLMSYKMGSVSSSCHICACKFMHAYIYRDLWSSALPYWILQEDAILFANVVLFPEFNAL